MSRVLHWTENEEDDVDFDDGKKEGRRRRGGTGGDRERSLPPLLARVNGQIEVILASWTLSCILPAAAAAVKLWKRYR